MLQMKINKDTAGGDMNLHNRIYRSCFILLLITAGNTVFPFAAHGSCRLGASLTWVSFADIWSKIFVYGDTGVLGEVQVAVRDSVTGEHIPARISFVSKDGAAQTSFTDPVGRGSFHLPTGRNDLEITAHGYNSLKAYVEPGKTPLSITVWLDPLEVPVETQPELIASDLHNGSTLIHGHVFDDESGKPVSDAHIYLENATTDGRSDSNGYFRLYVPTPPVDPAGDLPGTDDLMVEVNGKVVYSRDNMFVAAGATHLIIDINRSTPVTIDDTHKLMLSRVGQENPQSNLAEPSESNTEPDQGVLSETDQPSTVTVPTSIRVGSSCPTKLTCSVFNVYTLDTYTRLGLDDEWISSWNTNSLKAGAIAFRSYGVYHVFHPLTANYDICNTTSCQVMDPADSATSTDTATAQTTGSIVVDSTGTNPFFAEYAAENNGNSCPDGTTGNNGTWPCMSDIVDAGQTFNGHGRGMCQWGTQRWSVNQGKDFIWIVNHYYNDNGSGTGLRTGILQSSANSVLPPPTLATPGVSNVLPGAAITSLAPTFEWQGMAGADGYSLYISKFNGSTYDLIFNSETVVGQPLTGTTYTLPNGFLQVNEQYRWNMSSHNAAGYGSPNTFRTYFYVSLPAIVNGRVLTPDGRGLRNASVSLIDPQNNKRIITTNSLGNFTFDNVPTGPSYTITVTSKLYRFASQTVQITSDLTLPNFVGQE